MLSGSRSAFRTLTWQPSDTHPDALASIAAWAECFRPARTCASQSSIDASSTDWPISTRGRRAEHQHGAHQSVGVHRSGLIAGAARLLPADGPLILYGPWLKDDIETAPSNLAFDADLKARDRGVGPSPRGGFRRGCGRERVSIRRLAADAREQSDDAVSDCRKANALKQSFTVAVYLARHGREHQRARIASRAARKCCFRLRSNTAAVRKR